jgi:hypothetical protein
MPDSALSNHVAFDALQVQWRWRGRDRQGKGMPFISRYSRERGQVMNVEGKGCRGCLSLGRHSQSTSTQFMTFSHFSVASIALMVLALMSARSINTPLASHADCSARSRAADGYGVHASLCRLTIFVVLCERCNATRGLRTLFIGCHLTPGVNSPPIKIFATDRDGGGRFLFVLACGLVAMRSESTCPTCPCCMQHQLLQWPLTKVLIPCDVSDITASAKYHQKWCLSFWTATFRNT